MKTVNYKKQFAMFSLAAAFVAAGPMCAHANDATVDAPTRIVRYADLNLDTQAGVAVLYKRIRNAAKLVCGDVNSRQFNEAAAAKACVVNAVDDSVRSVNSAMLTASLR